MSESAGAASAGGSQTATPGAGSADNAASSQDLNGGAAAQRNTGTEQAAKTNEPADDFEEIALGSVKGKVPKLLAKAIKDFERGAQSRMSEAAQARKEAKARDELFALLNSDPDAFAERYGKMTGRKLDLDAFAEERLARKFDMMNMTPEQRRLHEAEAQIKQMKDADLASKKGVIDQIKSLLGADAPENLERYPKDQLVHFLQGKQQLYERTQQDLNNEVLEAWKESGLPKHKYFGSLMAFQMMSHQKRTGEPLQAKEAAAKVKGDFVKAVKEIVAQLDPQGIQDLLGADVMAKVRQADIDRVTSKVASTVGQHNRPGNQSASDKPKRPMNEYEYREYIRKMKV